MRYTAKHMCGINGTFGLPEGQIERMNAALEHRGPDWSGVWRNGALSLGHRLLSIRDAADVSRQPVEKPGNPWTLVFNGQLYNVRAMKKELSADYANIELDTTLLYALIEKHQWNFTRFIEGMYAIALYNANEKTLRLYRDPAGQKPLYYLRQGRAFAFSSEIKGLAAAGVTWNAVDPVGLTAALGLGYIPGSRTLIKGVAKLAPGEIRVIRLPQLEESQEWIPWERERVFSGKPSDVLQELIAEHLASKQKVALNLSGGLDSSLILHEAKQAGHTLHTYTTFFEGGDEKSNADALIARKLAKEYGTHHTEITITKDRYLDLLEESFAAIEEPNYNISLATYLATAKAEGAHGDGNRVVLSGDGGDELFGGYPHYWEGPKYEALLKKMPHFALSTYKYMREGMRWRYDDPLSLWLHARFFFDGKVDLSTRRDALLEYLRDSLPPPYAMRAKDPVRDLMLLDRSFWLASENFIRTDKLFMQESIEMRAPLSYDPLRKYFDGLLMRDDYGNTMGNKRFLRELYRGKLPDYVIDRKPKTGWRAPIAYWWDEAMRDRFLAVLGKPGGTTIDWNKIRAQIKTAQKWPGKKIHLYLSLAVLARNLSLPL